MNFAWRKVIMGNIIDEVTRRLILDELLIIGYVSGNMEYASFVDRVYPEAKELPVIYDRRYNNLRDEIWKHKDMNNDFTDSEMFYTYLKLDQIDDEKFIFFLEQYVNPIINRRRYDEQEEEWIPLQEECVNAINRYLLSCNLRLEVKELRSDKKIFEIVSLTQGVDQSIKNIIYAAKFKPDIVIDDALANNIHIVKNEEQCLIFDKEIPEKGLFWQDMVDWYAEKYNLSHNVEEAYVKRLKEAIGESSPPEQLFFDAYIELKNEMVCQIPALIPQVYLYYDPLTKQQRGWKEVFEHQRMDFFMLFSLKYRVVIEIDGQQHYADDEIAPGTRYKHYASPQRYAKMVSAQRSMSLYGYDVYRFGGKELSNPEEGKRLVKDFLRKLFRKYGVITD